MCIRDRVWPGSNGEGYNVGVGDSLGKKSLQIGERPICIGIGLEVGDIFPVLYFCRNKLFGPLNLSMDIQKGNALFNIII